MAYVTVEIDYCKGCGLCVDFCPQSIMQLDREIITQKGYHPAHCTDQASCTGCLNCAVMCPDVAITIKRSQHD
ncbi:MAG: 4Fe-4S binding protein [Coriobacteriales bacterium]|jgi:2-oxoglutarate ferredoxin oxidoreductase subunit delta|nr:4Fe-4S binding protein [Coriobacteriales bacterium]